MRGELGEVVGRRVREDDPFAREAREADVRESGQRLAAVAHALDRAQRRLEPEPVIRTDRGDIEVRQRGGRLFCGHAPERLRVLVEGQEAHDREPGDAPNRTDRGEELVELVERLDHEEVDAAALEELRLLGEGGVAVFRRAAEGADRAGDEHVRTGHLARVARDLHRGLVDRCDVVFEVVLGQLAAVRAEGVRLDDVRSRADEPEVERKDALRRSDVRLLGAAQPRNRARDERPHPPVTHERRSIGESFEKAPGHGAASLCRQ